MLSRQRIEGAKIQATLQGNGIPAEFVGEVDFFATSVVRLIVAYLGFASTPLLAGVALSRIMLDLGIDELTIQRINTYAQYEKAVEGVSDGVFESMMEAKKFLQRQVAQVEGITRRLPGVFRSQTARSTSRVCA